MLFTIQVDNMGCLTGYPVNVRQQKRIASHMLEMTNHFDHTFFIQTDYEVEQFIIDYVPKRKQADARNGWKTTFRADAWQIGHYYGWDCHTLFE